MTNAELFERYEKDILYDCHSLRARISRSGARKEIVRRKEELFPLVQQHVAEKKGSQDNEVLKAWAVVLSEMETTPDPETEETAGSLLAELLSKKTAGASEDDLVPLEKKFSEHSAQQLGGAEAKIKFTPPA